MEGPRLWRTQHSRLEDLGIGSIFTFSEDLAIVELENGRRVTARLTDFDSQPRIGEIVKCVTRKYHETGDRGLIVYGYKFRPVLKGDFSNSSI